LDLSVISDMEMANLFKIMKLMGSSLELNAKNKGIKINKNKM